MLVKLEKKNMANGVEKESVLMMFSDEELREISGVKRGGDYIEVTCGCTSHRYGDAVGRLRVFSNGDLEITCECTPGCNEGLLLFGLPFSSKWVLIFDFFNFLFCMFNARVIDVDVSETAKSFATCLIQFKCMLLGLSDRVLLHIVFV